MATEAKDIIEEITNSINSVDSPVDLTTEMVHYHPTTADIPYMDEAVLPQVWCYYDAPRIVEQTTTVTECAMDVQLVYYYRHADGVEQDSLSAAQIEQDIMKAFRKVVYQIQERQRTVPGVPDTWVNSEGVQQQGRMGLRALPSEDRPVYMVSTEFSLSYDEEY